VHRRQRWSERQEQLRSRPRRQSDFQHLPGHPFRCQGFFLHPHSSHRN